MKRVLVTGAGGHIGRALALRLGTALTEGRLQSLTLVDRVLPDDVPRSVRLSPVEGDLGDPAVLEAALRDRPDTVFHLAGITSRVAEDDLALGLSVNVGATMGLWERLSQQGNCPVVVYASSIGVFGTPLPERIDDATVPAPSLSYGAQKRMMEILLADYSRRGLLDGRAPRLPSVVARPPLQQAALSSFASELIRAPAEGRHFTCPIGPDGQLWWLSLPACLEHLWRAASVSGHELPPGRAWNLPALRASVGEVVQALRRRFGPVVDEQLSFSPQLELQAQFARWPPLDTATAARLGMNHDGDTDTLIVRALGA